jgi:hypothetical protein
MKKNIFTIIVILTLCHDHQHLQAQKSYFDLSIGYGLPAAPNLMSATDYSSNSDGNYSYKRIKGTGSFGKGASMSSTVGYLFNEHIGAELGVGYLLGSAMRIRESENYTYSSFASEASISGTMLRISPCLRLTAGSHKARPYMRMGVVVGVAAQLKEKYNSKLITDAGTYNRVSETSFKGGLSLGFTGALGAHYKVDERWSVYAEAQLIAQSWAPKKSTLTKAEVNGKDILATMSTRDKEIEFVDEYTSSDPPAENEPTKMLKVFFPFSSAGVQIGLHVLLANVGK